MDAGKSSKPEEEKICFVWNSLSQPKGEFIIPNPKISWTDIDEYNDSWEVVVMNHRRFASRTIQKDHDERIASSDNWDHGHHTVDVRRGRIITSSSPSPFRCICLIFLVMIMTFWKLSLTLTDMPSSSTTATTALMSSNTISRTRQQGITADGTSTKLRKNLTAASKSLVVNMELIVPAENSATTTKISSLRSDTPSSISSSSPSSSSLSICLLIKDDNMLLPEWISYHYWAVQLRHLIVAIDPASSTSPVPILTRFTQQLPKLHVTIWSDDDYMPVWFVTTKNNRTQNMDDSIVSTVDKVPNLVPRFWFVNASTSPFHQHLNATAISREQLEQDYRTINEYWFRQRTFLTQCIRHVRHGGGTGTGSNSLATVSSTKATTSSQLSSASSSSSNSSHVWMAHIDTDEYIVVNPNLRGRNGSLAKELVLPRNGLNRIKCVARPGTTVTSWNGWRQEEEKEETTTTFSGVYLNSNHLVWIGWR